MNKNISIIKKSSLAIMVLSGLWSALYIFMGIYWLTDNNIHIQREICIKQGLNFFIEAAVLLLAGLVFYRIFRSGRPFTRGNIMGVRGIAGLFLIKGLVPVFVEGASLGIMKTGLQGLGSFFIAALFMFFAEIMRYGGLLQNESDETL